VNHKAWWLIALVAISWGVGLFGPTLVVEAQCASSNIDTFTISPSDSAVDQGTLLEVYGHGNCGTSMITVDGEARGEHGGPEITATIRTEEYSAGTHRICYLLRDDHDGGWHNATSQCNEVTFIAVANPTQSTAGMPNLNNYCESLGYDRGSFPNSNQAYGATCVDGNRVHNVDMSAVCRWAYGEGLSHAGLSNHRDPSSWSCNASPTYVDPQPPPQNNGGSGSGNNSSGGSSSGSSGNGSGSGGNGSSGNGSQTGSSSGNQGSGSGSGSISGTTGSSGNSNSSGSGAGCPSARSRVSVGTRVRVSDADSSPLPMRSQARTDSSIIANIPIRTELTIVAGPTCANNWRWWQVTYNGRTGWVGEVGPEGLYNFNPIGNAASGSSTSGSSGSGSSSGSSSSSGGSSQNTNCPHHVEPVYVGGQGQVTPGLGNIIRSGAGFGYEQIGIARPGVVFDVLAGPRCVDGWWWWQIEYNGTIGWTVEGDNQENWIENVGGGSIASTCSHLYCETNVDLPPHPRGTNHWVTENFYNDIYSQTQDRVIAYQNGLTLKDWAIEQGEDVVVVWVTQQLTGVNAEMVYAFLDESRADKYNLLAMWERRLENLDYYHSNQFYRFNEWTALPAGLVELPVTSNSFWWLFALDQIPW
jgi:uncharacterized membrane protein YgcG